MPFSVPKPVLLGLMIIAIAAGVVYYFFGSRPSSSSRDTSKDAEDDGPSISGNLQANAAAEAKPDTASSGGDEPLFGEGSSNEPPVRDTPPDRVLKTFAFEPYGRPLLIPTMNGRLGRKVAGTPAFTFVQCDIYQSGYAIRWSGKYLTLIDNNTLEWGDQKSEPSSCWRVVPGYCGGDEYVMLKSLKNNLFLTYDQASDALVCRDVPTGRTAKQYCWKLNPQQSSLKPCGCQYDYKLGRVVCTPCNVKKMPDTLGGSCSTVTPGYQAECCIEKKSSAQSDPFCRTAAWPEVVGRSLREAMLYLRTRRPDLVLQPCPSPCAISAFPEFKPGVVVIPYDVRSQLVTAAARRLI